jgi:hypothetical protein
MRLDEGVVGAVAEADGTRPVGHRLVAADMPTERPLDEAVRL